ARLVPRALVLEGHLTEPRESIPDVRRVVDRQTTSTARIDVCERAIGKLCSLLRAKRWHAQMIARTGGPTSAACARETGGGQPRRTSTCSRQSARRCRRPTLSVGRAFGAACGGDQSALRAHRV